MKKTVFALLLIGVTAPGFAQTAVIKEFTGVVELKHSGSPDFIPAVTGAEISRNTVVSTGFKSTAVLSVGSAVITVRPLTRLTLTEIQALQETDNINLSLQSGRVRVEVNPPAGSRAAFKATSPTSTASVRGTGFDFDARNLRVHKGTVAFMGRWGYEVSVREGFSSGIGASGAAGAPQKSDGFRLQQRTDDTMGTTGGSGIVGGKEAPAPGDGDTEIIVDFK